MSVINLEVEKNYKTAYDLFFYAEDNKKAKKYLERALIIDSQHIRSLKLKSTMLIFEDKIKSALEVLKSLNNLIERDFETSSKLAWCSLEAGDYAGAFEFLNESARCVDLDESEKMFVLYKTKIDLFIRINRKKSASKLLKNAIKNLPFDYAQELKNYYSNLNYNENPIVDFTKVKSMY